MPNACINLFLVGFSTSLIVTLLSVKVQCTDSGMFIEVAPPRKVSSNKITIVGAGNVGTAVAISLVTQYVGDEIVLIDSNQAKVEGEIQDLREGAAFIGSPKIYGGTDYTLTENSKICIVTAGANQEVGQKREDLALKNFGVFKTIIPQLMKYSPEAILIIVTNPVDIMTYISWKLAGEKNKHRIIGSGTNLDSARMRFMVSQRLNISPENVHGWVIGGHGDSSVWSGVNVNGVQLKDSDYMKNAMKTELKDDGKTWMNIIDEQMKASAGEIIAKKGKTSWAVGLSVTDIVDGILRNVPKIHAVSTYAQDIHGIQEEVFLSLPCVLGQEGIIKILKQPLEESEKEELLKSAAYTREIIDSLNSEQLKPSKTN